MESIGRMKSVWMAVCLAIGLVLGLGSPGFAKKAEIDFLGSSFGTSSYILGVAYEDIARRFYPDLEITTRETPGLIYNFRRLTTLSPEEKRRTVFTAYDGLVWLARQGKEPFPQKIEDPIKLLFNVPAMATYFMTRDKSIKSIEDLAGKRVAIGTRTQLGWGAHPYAYLTAGAGLDNVNVQWVGLSAALSAFKDNLVHAMPSGVYLNPVTKQVVPDPQTEEILSIGFDVRFLSPGSLEAVERIAAVTGLQHHIELPPGTLKGQEDPIIANMGLTYYACAPELEEDAAYHFVKMMIENVDKVRSYHSLGRLMTKESLAYGMTKDNLHPGAYRAFKEAGLVD